MLKYSFVAKLSNKNSELLFERDVTIIKLSVLTQSSNAFSRQATISKGIMFRVLLSRY
jgi:hypothetical protein